jgi:hypothetical protein
MPRYDDDDDDYDANEDRRPVRRRPKKRAASGGVPVPVLIGGGLIFALVTMGLMIFVAVKASRPGNSKTSFSYTANGTKTPDAGSGTPPTPANPAVPTVPVVAPVTVVYNLSNVRRGTTTFSRPTVSVDYDFTGEGRVSASHQMCIRFKDGQVVRTRLGGGMGNRDTMVVEIITFGGPRGAATAGRLEVWFEDSATGTRLSEVISLD